MSLIHHTLKRRTLTATLTFIVATGAAVSAASPASAHHLDPSPDFDTSAPGTGSGEYTEQQLATNGEGGFPNYRIPALTVTNDGDLLASYDGRPTGIDAPGPNSILQRRSTDNGATWGPQEVVAAGKASTPITGYSDPSYIVDRETGDVFNFHVKSFDTGFGGSQPGTDPEQRNVLHAAVSVSADEGSTWETEVITADVTADDAWRSRFAASGQGIQLKYGDYAGRLIQQFTIINGAGTFQAVSVYSDDHGATWQVGTPVGTGMDENKTVELSDGRVMLNSRDSARSGFRKVAYSTDGGVTYGAVTIDRELPDPANNASVVRAYPNAAEGSDDAKVLLFSNSANQGSRSNGVVRVSYDDGDTWPDARTFQPGSMSYSTLATLPDGNVGLLYEPGNGIRFATFDLDWVLDAPEITPGTVEVTGGTLTTEPGSYAVGDVLTYSYTVTNVSGSATTVVPTGNLDRLDPADGTPNCRWRGLVAGASYTCDFAQYTLTQDDIDAQRFTPVTTWTSTSGSAVTTVEHEGPGTYFGTPGTIEVTGGTLNDTEREYAVGDTLGFTYRVQNLSTSTTTVVPTGNLDRLDPADGAPNCRWRGLEGDADYTCTTASHTVTEEDVTAGGFTPVTTWTSTSGDSETVVEHEGPRVDLSAPEPPVAAWEAEKAYTSGNLVTYEKSTWEATWWTKNQVPGSSTTGSWQEIQTDADGIAVWTPTRIFTSGDSVIHDGTSFTAKWWTRDQIPGTTNGPWEATN